MSRLLFPKIKKTVLIFWAEMISILKLYYEYKVYHYRRHSLKLLNNNEEWHTLKRGRIWVCRIVHAYTSRDWWKLKNTYATALGLFCNCWIIFMYSGSVIHCLVLGSFRNFTNTSGDLNGFEKILAGPSEINYIGNY